MHKVVRGLWARLRRGGIVVTAVLLVGACGGSSSGSPSGNSNDNPQGKQAAAQAVKDASGPVTWTDPGPAFAESSLKGKTIWVIVSDYSIPFLQTVVASMKEAASAAGVKLHVFDGKGITQTASNGIEQALAGGAAAIDIISVNTQFVSAAVGDANQAHIPVIGILNTDPSQPVEKGAAAEVTIDYALSGKLLVAYAVANTNGPVNAFFLTLPSIATFDAMKIGIKDGFSQYCSSACVLNTADLTEGDFKNETQSNTSSGLLRYPKLNWVIPAIDVMGQFAVPSIVTAGKQSDVRLGSINAFQANLKFIQTGNVQVVDVGNSNSWLGWSAIDRTLRAMAGAQPSITTVPVKLFDKSNLTGVDISDESKLFPGVDFRSKYQALWTQG